MKASPSYLAPSPDRHPRKRESASSLLDLQSWQRGRVDLTLVLERQPPKAEPCRSVVRSSELSQSPVSSFDQFRSTPALHVQPRSVLRPL